MYITSALLLLATAALSLPTTTSKDHLEVRKPKPQGSCPSGWTHISLNFDNLKLDKGGKTHPVNVGGTEAENYYGHFWFAHNYWQVISPGIQEIQESFARPNKFNMTTHSAKGGLVTTQSYAYFSREYSTDYFGLQSMWVRPQSAGAWGLHMSCSTRPNDGTTTKTVDLDFQIPELPYGEYSKVSLTPDQQKLVQWASDCTLTIDDSGEGYSVFLMDDLEYCYLSTA